MAEYQKGDVAHIRVPLFVTGDYRLMLSTNVYHRHLMLRKNNAITITAVHHMAGAAVYDAIYEYWGTKYQVQSIPETSLWSKRLWAQYLGFEV